MKRFFILFVLISISLSGCLSGGSSNPVGPSPEVTSTGTPEESVATDSATLTIRVVLPNHTTGIKSSTRPSTVSTAISVPYASATLLVDSRVNQKKTAQVIDGSVQMTFTGVPDSGEAVLYLELVGCSINGIHNFSGATSLTSGENVVELSPRIVPGSNMTSDGKVLVEIGTPDYLGWTDNKGRITFNDLGQPIGFACDNYITNYATGEKYMSVEEILEINPDVAFTDVAWFEECLWLCGNNIIAKIDIPTKTVTMYGLPSEPRNTTDGSTLANARFAAVSDMQVYGDTLYFSSGNFTQLLKLKDGVFSVTAIPYIQDGISVLEDGKVFYTMRWNSTEYDVFRLEGNTIVEGITLPEDKYANNMVAYKDGYLISSQFEIYYWDGNTLSEWISDSTFNLDRVGRYYIYKNAQGTIYVCSEYANKIWEVK